MIQNYLKGICLLANDNCWQEAWHLWADVFVRRKKYLKWKTMPLADHCSPFRHHTLPVSTVLVKKALFTTKHKKVFCYFLHLPLAASNGHISKCWFPEQMDILKCRSDKLFVESNPCKWYLPHPTVVPHHHPQRDLTKVSSLTIQIFLTISFFSSDINIWDYFCNFSGI